MTSPIPQKASSYGFVLQGLGVAEERGRRQGEPRRGTAEMQQPSRMNECYISFAKLRMESAICDKIHDQGVRDYCLSEVAKDHGLNNLGICTCINL